MKPSLSRGRPPAAQPQPPLPLPPTAASASRAAALLPYEVFFQILALAATDQQVGPKLLLLSKDIYERLSAHVYAKVTLSSAQAIDAFAALLRARPEIARKVKSLWIGPTEMHSDLLSTLAPPETFLQRAPELRHKVHAYAKFILRACRKVDTLALSGGLCTPDAAFSYGTACQPRHITCVNPHSFVGAFSAPIFNKATTLVLIDTSLAVEDGDQISKMQNLRHFIWISPKDSSDPAQETGRIHRLVLQSLNGELPAHLTTGAQFAGSDMDLSPNFASKLSTRAKNLERISLVTSQGRCVAFARSVQPIGEMRLDMADDDGDADSGVFFAQSSAAPAAQVPPEASAHDKWIRVRMRSLDGVLIDEWQALQEEVKSLSFRWDDYRPQPKPPEHEQDGPIADGRQALRAFHSRWVEGAR